MKHPVWWVLGGCAAVIVAAGVLPIWQMAFKPKATPGADQAAAAPIQGLPWQVEVRPDGSSRVMGLHLGADTMAQVRARVGDSLQVALVAGLGEVGVLEALAEPFNAAFISGRLVLAFEVSASTLRRWRDAATGSSAMEGGMRRFALRSQDLAEAERAALSGLSFVPVARLTEVDVRQRFGPPDRQRSLESGATLMWYPKLGVSATLAPGQRSVIQYVAPRDAARLWSPADSGSSGLLVPSTAATSSGG